MMNCPHTHGWKEYDFHPKIYKLRACKQGKVCKYKDFDCPFYHGKKDMRTKYDLHKETYEHEDK
jgi:hypothetical protein